MVTISAPILELAFRVSFRVEVLEGCRNLQNDV